MPNVTLSPISRRFEKLKAERRKALICYVTAGYPSAEQSVELLQGLESAGADIVEVGVPFSDPMADGPVIQRSSQVAIEQGITLNETFAILQRASLTIPVVLFSYLNPILAAGTTLTAKAAASGISGLLITDLPVGADPERESWLGSQGLDLIRLVAPTTPLQRMKDIGSEGRGGGFVYLISRLGVTGEQSSLAAELPDTVSRLRTAVSLPICVGFGISSAKQAVEASRYADGVIVGSAIVRAAGVSINSAIELVREMRDALDADSAA